MFLFLVRSKWTWKWSFRFWVCTWGRWGSINVPAIVALGMKLVQQCCDMLSLDTAISRSVSMGLGKISVPWGVTWLTWTIHVWGGLLGHRAADRPWQEWVFEWKLVINLIVSLHDWFGFVTTERTVQLELSAPGSGLGSTGWIRSWTLMILVGLFWLRIFYYSGYPILNHWIILLGLEGCMYQYEKNLLSYTLLIRISSQNDTCT